MTNEEHYHNPLLQQIVMDAISIKSITNYMAR